MANVVRKWLPLVLITGAIAASAAIYDGFPPAVDVQLGQVLVPFEVAEPDPPLRREVALFLMPAVALIVWAAFRAAPTAGGQRIGRALFRNAPEAVTSAEQFDRFGKTYDTIVLAVVLVFIGVHAAILLLSLGYAAIAARIVPLVVGASLILMGNVMPRLRANWVAGLRTRRLLEDPQLWRSAHRVFGAAFVASGAVTMIVGVLAPAFGVLTAVAGIAASCLIGFVVSTRRSELPAR